MTIEKSASFSRRSLIGAAGGIAAAPLLGTAAFSAQATEAAGAGKGAAPTIVGRRRLGTLDVSSIGLGVQNMSRTYQTTIPTRSEMYNIIRTAFYRGVTFFDAAEA